MQHVLVNKEINCWGED